jgi:hypothetical protein
LQSRKSVKKTARRRFCRTAHKPVWVGAFPFASSTPAPEGKVLSEAKLLLLNRYKELNGIYPSGHALIEMRQLAQAAADSLDYVMDEKLLKKFLRKRITKLVNAWALSDWKRRRESRGGETKVLSYGAALGWKIDQEKAKEYNTQIGARRAAERIEDLKYHVFELLEGNDRERYEALIYVLDALEFDPVGNVAIWKDTTLRQTAKDLTELCGIQTDHKALSRLIDKVRKLTKAQIARPRFHKGAIRQRYEAIKNSAEETAKNVIVDATDGKPLLTFRFKDQRTSKGRDVGEVAQALEAVLKGLVDSIPKGAPKKNLAALSLSIWQRPRHHHLPENCLGCRLRIEQIRTLAAKWGKDLKADTTSKSFSFNQ